uniref:NADH-ubiquinone oxidoreductase chain 2 n=1 Tax=Phyllodromica sp. Phil TaxID=2093477 RepID=A0A2P1H9L7_9NEOP|nr:NADH dehydrogenase subunit 2 [Phyllodromica sp. Phil]
MLFFTILMLGLFVTISSNSWMGAWMGLEINLMSFIPIMSNKNNMFTTEASLKYFLIQTFASVSLLFLILSKSFLENLFSLKMISLTNTILMAPLLMKMGASPFHWWFPSVMEGLSWNNCFILMTIQKIAPLSLISYFLIMNSVTFIIIMTSIIIGAMGGLNQVSIRKMLTYSSINHIGWILTAMTIGNNYWWMYFSIYTSLTIAIISIMKPFQASSINQILLIMKNNPILKFLMFSSLLSLGGLPPFLGFLPKWIIIQSLTQNEMYLLGFLMTIFSLITLYYYLRISYSSLLLLSLESNWNFNMNYDFINMMIMVSMMSLLGLMICTFLLNVL